MKILVKKVKMQRRLATTSIESGSEIAGEPSLTYDKAVMSFERKEIKKNSHKQQQNKKNRRKKPANAPFLIPATHHL